MNFLKYFKKLKAGIIVFPGTNCDRDTKIALDGAGFNTDYIFTKIENFQKALEVLSSEGIEVVQNV